MRMDKKQIFHDSEIIRPSEWNEERLEGNMIVELLASFRLESDVMRDGDKGPLSSRLACH